jgi:methyl-accepting chemotaxis protein
MNPRKKRPPLSKRKQRFINKEFQTRFILKFCLILIVGGGISIGLTLFNTQETLTSSFSNSKLVIQNTSLAIMPSVIYTTVISTLVIGLIVIMATLLASHKIAGPMFRFEQDIDRISTGDLKSRIDIRTGDQFQAIAVSLNKMIDSLNNKVADIKQDANALAMNEALPESCRREILLFNEKINTYFKL